MYAFVRQLLVTRRSTSGYLLYDNAKVVFASGVLCCLLLLAVSQKQHREGRPRRFDSIFFLARPLSVFCGSRGASYDDDDDGCTSKFRKNERLSHFRFARLPFPTYVLVPK